MNIYTNFYHDTSIYTDQGYIPMGVFFGSSQKVEIPSFFDEDPAGDGHNVCHVKCLNAGIQAVKGTTTLDIKEGRFDNGFIGSRHSVSSVHQVVIQGHHMYLYTIRYQGDGYFQMEFSLAQWKFYKSGDKLYYGRGTGVNDFSKWYRATWDSSRQYWQWTEYADRSHGVPYSIKKLCLSAVKGIVLGSKMPDASNHPWYSERYGRQVYYDLLDQLMEYIPLSVFDTNGSIYQFYPEDGYSVKMSTPSKNLDSYLLFDEHALLFESGYSSKPYAASRIKAMRQDSYLDALDHIPQVNENSLANVVELVGFIKTLVIDHRIEIPKSLQSAWLSYRYSYATTKSDVEEAIAFVHRNVDDDFLKKGFSCFGSVSEEYLGVPIQMRCRIDVKEKELDTLSKIWTSLYRYGLSPSFYMIWDMIPYSFIIDWFIPVGDILSGYDKTHMYDRTYDITNIWYSIKYVQEIDNFKISSYTRWTEGCPAEFDGSYVLINKGSVSNKTIGFRILDAASILIR